MTALVETDSVGLVEVAELPLRRKRAVRGDAELTQTAAHALRDHEPRAVGGDGDAVGEIETVGHDSALAVGATRRSRPSPPGFGPLKRSNPRSPTYELPRASTIMSSIVPAAIDERSACRAAAPSDNCHSRF